MRVTAVILGLVAATAVAAESGINVSYREPLQQLRMVYTTNAEVQKPGVLLVRSLHFDAFDRRFDIDLEVNRTLLDATQRELLAAEYEIYRGEISGIPGSWARLVIADSVPSGMLWDGAEIWAIEAGKNSATGVEETSIFRLSDVQIAPDALTCSEVKATTNGAEFAKAMLSEVSTNFALGPGATTEIDLAVIGDFEFTTDKGSNANTALVTRMNNIDGIFSMQLGVQLNANRVDTYSTNNDPFSDETDSGLLLDELTDYRFGTPAQHANGLTHLFTGRNLDGSTVGIAYSGALCSRRYGAGLTEGTHSTTMDSLIAAHEIGHNFGAPHDGTSGSPCESEAQDFLMAPRLNGSDEFSACSIAEMQDDVNRASCITLLANTDVAVLAGGQPAAVLLGDVATISFEVNSIGSADATGVDLDVSIPAGVSVNSISTTLGSCSSGAGTASCAIGSIAAGSGASVTIDVTTVAVGAADFVANASATSDENSGNDQATVQFTVDPAIDLVSTAGATSQVTVNQNTTLRPTIGNNSSIAATNVSVTVTADAGIRVDSANWSPGNCSIDGNVVTCGANSLAAQSTNTLQLGVTGLAQGSQFYSITSSAAETDRATANNEDTGQVNVAAAPTNTGGGSDSGGSGSLGWLSLMFLMLVPMLSSRRVRH